MSRFALIGRQQTGTSPNFTPKWNARATLAASDGVKLINYSIKPNRNPTKEEGLHTMSYSFVAGGVFKPDGSLEGYYRCDSNVGNGIIKAVFGSEFLAADTAHPLTTDKALKYGSVETEGNKLTFTLTKTNCNAYYLGNEIWPYTMRLVEDGPNANKFNEFKNTLFQNLSLTFDTREFPKFKVDFIAGPSRNGLDTGEAAIDDPTFTNSLGTDLTNPAYGKESKPAAFYNAVIEICYDPAATTPVWATLGCKSLTLNIARKLDENYVYIGSPFLAGAALNGVSDVNGNFTTGAGLTEYEMFDSMFHDASNVAVTKHSYGELLQDTNAMKTFALRFALFDTDFNMIGFFNAGTAVLTEGSKNIQGRQVIERTINYTCYGNPKDMYFLVPMWPIIGTGGTLQDPPQQFTGAFKGLAKEYSELVN